MPIDTTGTEFVVTPQPDLGVPVTELSDFVVDSTSAGFNYATSSILEANTAIETLVAAVAAMTPRPPSGPTSSIEFTSPVSGGASIAPPTPPDYRPAEIVMPSLGFLPDITLPSLPSPPDGEIDLPEVNLSIPMPAPLSAVAPTDPGAMIDVVVPDAPIVSLPEAPNLATVSVPDLPTIDLPSFDALLRDAPLAPDTTFSFSEPAYTSSLLTAYQSVILSWVQGASTGLAPDVEEALWNRARDREAAQYGAALTQVARDFAARGFPVPPGAAAMLAQQAMQKAREASSTVNRDIAIKQAELEQANRQFALSEARQIEMGLMTYASNAAQRAFEGAKYIVEASIAVYGAQVQQYNADVQAFTARASVYRDLIQGELAKLEVYKSQIEGARLVAALNEQAVAIYTARLEGVKTMISVYEQRVSAAKVQAEVQRTQIEAFKTRVDAYGETVKAKAAEYDAYATRVRAEVSKYELPKAQAEILRASSDAYSSQVRGVIDAKGLEIKVKHELPINVYEATVDASAKLSSAAAAQMQARAAMADTEVRRFAAQVDAQVRQESNRVEVEKARSQEAVGRYQVDTQREIGEMQNNTDMSRIQSAAAIAAGQQAAQIAAAQLAQFNYSQSQSVSTSSSVSQSQAISSSMNDSFSYSRSIIKSE